MLDIQKDIWKPKIVVEEIDNTTAKFEVEYLPRGFWCTLWNSLRRMILWYDLWWAVTWIKIKWVPHEYYVVEWVNGSVLDMILSFKKLRFKVAEWVEKLQWVSQRFKWTGKFYSKDLKLPSWVELLSDDVFLFEITDPWTELVIEYRVEKWYGYYNMEYLKKRDMEQEAWDVGVFLIDNDFKIVDYIKYDVEEVIDDFSGSSKDKLVLELKSISEKVSPKEILSFAAEIISSYAKVFVFDESYIDKSVQAELSDMEDSSDHSSEKVFSKTIPIDALPLSERTRNALIKNEILYVEDLELKRRSELLSMKGVWKKAVDEIITSLVDLGKNLAW